VIVAVYTVFKAYVLPGVNVATAPVQLTVPATAVVPGPVTLKVVAGDARVEQSIASLKVAVSVWPIGTPVAVFTGTTAVTAGGGVIVVKVHT
jgi:hypothetical protein